MKFATSLVEYIEQNKKILEEEIEVFEPFEIKNYKLTSVSKKSIKQCLINIIERNDLKINRHDYVKSMIDEL